MAWERATAGKRGRERGEPDLGGGEGGGREED
jgi:hypothetical protein